MNKPNQSDLLATMILAEISNKINEGEDIGNAITSASKQVLSTFLDNREKEYKLKIERAKDAYNEMVDSYEEVLTQKDKIINNIIRK